MAKLDDIHELDLGSVFLDLQNPRFEPVDDEAEAIEELCSTEDILGLAVDYVEQGSLNPLELFGLIPAKPDEDIEEATRFVVAEGNRRLCALKLLHDPDKAPANLREKFQALASEIEVTETILGVKFADRAEAKPWLDRLHLAGLGGAARKRWTSDQQVRHEGGGRNKASADFLDWSETEGLISGNDRKRKLTTVDRFMSNPAFREKFGFDKSDPSRLHTNRPDADIRARAKRFLDDLVDGTRVNSRMSSADIQKYAEDLERDIPVSGSRKPSAPLLTSNPDSSGKKARRTKPKPPKSPDRAYHSSELDKALRDLGKYKLQSMYHSITSLDLQLHVPLITVGIWSLIESLTALCGRAHNVSFDSFLSFRELEARGVPRKETRTVSDALKRISGAGNTTKHHGTSATFDPTQLSNDLETVSPILAALAKEARNAAT